MTPLLNDLDYLEELTACLTNTLARLLQLRPPDPISFIENSLRQHRRLHPKQEQGREIEGTTCPEIKTPVASPESSPSAPNPKESSPLDVHDAHPSAPDTRSRSTAGTTKHLVEGRIGDETDDILEDTVDDHLDSSPSSNLVHSHIQTDLRAIGDLFDDYDFG